MSEKKSILRKCTDKLFGGMAMSWLLVILLAVGSAIVTAVFLIVPVFENTSFVQMGTTFEAWILLAVFIMSNCRSPLDSALKTFVFFLISQPLIYLLQVPFSAMGWGLFGFYRYWFIWTLLTFPMALGGWYIKQKSWLSFLILTPVMLFLGYFGFNYANTAVFSFPYHLIAALCCFGQILLYLYVFLPDRKKSIAAIGIIAVAVAAVALLTPQVQVTYNGYYLPDDPSYSASASIKPEDSELADISFSSPEEGTVNINAHRYGTTTVTIQDGGKTYEYTLRIQNEKGHDTMEIVPASEK